LLRGLTAALVFGCLIGSGFLALGHEQRQVGAYTLEVGWRDEPALEGMLNAVQVEVRETATGHGVEGSEKTLRVLVSFGGGIQTFEPVIEPVFGQAGTYTGAIIPTRSGDYLFRVAGKINQQNVDERFESGPGRFDVVRSPSTLQFPDQAGTAGALGREQRATREIAEQTRLVALGGLTLSVVAVSLALLALRRRSGLRRP